MHLFTETDDHKRQPVLFAVTRLMITTQPSLSSTGQLGTLMMGKSEHLVYKAEPNIFCLHKSSQCENVMSRLSKRGKKLLLACHYCKLFLLGGVLVEHYSSFVQSRLP